MEHPQSAQVLRIGFTTLGCRLNQFESDSLANRFRDAGYTVCDDDSEVDVRIINSCTVTGRADRKSRFERNAAMRRNGKVVMMGCSVSGPFAAQIDASGEVLSISNEHKAAAFEMVDAWLRGELDPQALPHRDAFDYGASQPLFTTRGMLKIQDGCDNFCSFCIIPHVRGQGASRPMPEILQHARELVGGGLKELVLTGVNIGRYQDQGHDFAALLNGLLDIDGDFRIRLSSLEPDGLGPAFFRLFQHPRLCRHLHLCLQSGSDRILSAMRRQYSLADFERIVSALRDVDSRFSFTTDIMVGFPGETEADLQATLDAVRRLEFAHVHVFPYSRRSHTAADRMREQVPEAVKKERAEAVRHCAESVKRSWRERFVGTTERLLVEQVAERQQDGAAAYFASGYGERYVPIKVRLAAGSEPAANRFVSVKIETLDRDLELLASEINPSRSG